MGSARPEPLVLHCVKASCGHEFAPAFLPIELGAVARLLKQARCPRCRSPKLHLGFRPKPTPLGQWENWIGNGDTGTSSETIWHVLTGKKVPRPRWRAGVPLDPSDFGRCYRLLQAMPGWRERLPEVAARFRVWAPFVDAWGELTALYEAEVPNHTGQAPQLYARLQALRGDGAGR